MEIKFCHETNVRFHCLATVKIACVIHASLLMWTDSFTDFMLSMSGKHHVSEHLWGRSLEYSC